ncbi:hypothetical protein AYW79_02430 [Ferroacidibacillus organovorans]|uniref:Uncharacterized protein n=1 Tax=Ferroacidibacillus organovorans TaxID=1765683 RepID=A0A162SHP7_9BACL|nr:hypothetical protein AYJ22_13375 [Ferroacidibacillus organovorans]OAG95086.1 hypothetical protein AYW79_02430 [Ferroacidibacillus organovorans]OPG17591.1 hypothetical protein B2M26_00070 [Ferroacidibacillus organovorans]
MILLSKFLLFSREKIDYQISRQPCEVEVDVDVPVGEITKRLSAKKLAHTVKVSTGRLRLKNLNTKIPSFG